MPPIKHPCVMSSTSSHRSVQTQASKSLGLAVLLVWYLGAIPPPGFGQFGPFDADLNGVKWSFSSVSDVDGNEAKNLLITGRDRSAKPAAILHLNRGNGGDNLAVTSICLESGVPGGPVAVSVSSPAPLTDQYGTGDAARLEGGIALTTSPWLELTTRYQRAVPTAEVEE